MIEVRFLKKSFDRRAAVSDLSFRVEPGQVLGLVGPNGAGKTTTLRCIAGVLTPTDGTLRVDGHDVVRDPIAAKRRLAIVADDPQLFQHLTVWEHLEFTSKIYRLDRWTERAEQLLTSLELLDRRDALCDELSRGMRQKVAVSCALLHEPAAMLLDEPMAGLDPRGIRTLFSALRSHAEGGAAVIISSHLLGQIDALCTQFLILREGRLLFFGSKDEIRAELPAMQEDASLEEIFFQATEGGLTES